MRLLLCPLDLEAQFSRSNREYLGAAPLSSGPNSAEGVTLVLSVEKGKKKKLSPLNPFVLPLVKCELRPPKIQMEVRVNQTTQSILFYSRCPNSYIHTVHLYLLL